MRRVGAKEYVSLREATRIWPGSNTYAVMRAAAMDMIQVLALPGETLMFLRSDVERLAAERGLSTTMAE